MTAEISRHTELSLVLIDNHCVLRDGLQSLFDSVPEFSVAAAFSSPVELPSCIDLNRVDVIVTELSFDEVDILCCIGDWARAFPGTKTLVLSQYPESIYAERSLNAGAAGYLMKDTPTARLIEAVREVYNGRPVLSSAMSNQLLGNFSKWRNENPGDFDCLSDRELMVTTLIGQGRTTAQIAHALGINKKTVSTYKEQIKDKLLLDSCMQLTQIALQKFGRNK